MKMELPGAHPHRTPSASKGPMPRLSAVSGTHFAHLKGSQKRAAAPLSPISASSAPAAPPSGTRVGVANANWAATSSATSRRTAARAGVRWAAHQPERRQAGSAAATMTAETAAEGGAAGGD